MSKYLKEFLVRGMMFAGFGPVILGIIYFVLQKTSSNFSLSGDEAFLGIVTIYILAFVQAGATVFNQIEDWPITKSILFHFLSLYLVYTLCYLINTWIPFKAEVLLIFTAVFIGIYIVIWLIVFLIVKTVSKKINKGLNS